MAVMNDLFSHVDRALADLKRQLHDLDRALNPSAEAAGPGKHDLFNLMSHGTVLSF
jgi:hypothetical protein